MRNSVTSIIVAIGFLVLSGLPSLHGGLAVVADLAVPYTTPIPARPIFFRPFENAMDVTHQCGKSFCGRFESCCGKGCCPPGSTCWADGKGCCPNGATCIEPTVSWLPASATDCSPWVCVWASSLCCPSNAPLALSAENWGSGCFELATATGDHPNEGPALTTTATWTPTPLGSDVSFFVTAIPTFPPDTEALKITIQEVTVTVTRLPRNNEDTAASAIPDDPKAQHDTTVTATVDEPCTTVTVSSIVYVTLSSHSTTTSTSSLTDVTTTIRRTVTQTVGDTTITQTFEMASSVVVAPTAISSSINATTTAVGTTNSTTTSVRTITQTLSVSSSGSVIFNLTATSSTSLPPSITSHQSSTSWSNLSSTTSGTVPHTTSASVSLCFDIGRATHTLCSGTAISPGVGFNYSGAVVSNINTASRHSNSPLAFALLVIAIAMQL